MLKWRAPWWIYAIAAVYVLTFFFNARQEAWGPANAGWVPAWPTFNVVAVQPGGPMAKAGVRAGDILEAVDGQLLTGMPDWFLVQAHFERDQPVELLVRHGDRHLTLRLVITAPAWRTWTRVHILAVLAFSFARFILLLLAILIAFRRPKQLSARLAALMLLVGAVAEGYPSSGWAAALRHSPVVLAIPICLATASCLLAPVVWLQFFALFPRPRLTQRWRRALVLLPVVLFGVPIVASAVAIIYAPSALAKAWPLVLSAAPVRLVQDIAGVAPLLFLNVPRAYQPTTQARLLEVWLALTVLYFAAGLLMLGANYRRLHDLQERRRIGALCLALLLFGVVVIHNFFTRNWTGWFGSVPPALFSEASYAVETALFLFVPLTLAYCVLSEGQPSRTCK